MVRGGAEFSEVNLPIAILSTDINGAAGKAKETVARPFACQADFNPFNADFDVKPCLV